MIHSIVYQQGKTKELDLKDVNRLRHSCWVDLENPSSEELRKVASKFNVPKSELEHALDLNERPRVKHAKDYTLIIFSVPTEKRNGQTKRKKQLRPLALLLGKRFVITVHLDVINSLENLDISSEVFKTPFSLGVEALAYYFLSIINKEFSPLLENLEDDVDGLDDIPLHENFSDRDFLLNLTSVRSYTTLLRRALSNNREVVAMIIKANKLKNAHDFDELYVEQMQLVSQIELLRERASTSTDVYFAMSSSRVNNTMKSFTAVASLLLVPMLITGIYGMNIALPAQNNAQAFAGLMGLIIFIILVLFFYFKGKRFL